MPVFKPKPGNLADDCAQASACELFNVIKRIARMKSHVALDRLRRSFRACLAAYEHFRRKGVKDDTHE